MCGRIIGLLLAALFAFVVVTVAAFVYLEWWQAILASAATFLLMIFGAKLLIRTAIGRVGEFAKEMFRTKSRALQGATVDVHHIHPTSAPEELEQLADSDDPEDDQFDRAEARAEVDENNWYEVEVTIFPDPNSPGPMTHWDLDDLRLVPLDAPPPDPFGMGENEPPDEFPLRDVELIENGVASSPDESKLQGPQRLRFVVGVPKTLRAVKFQYYFEHFGMIRLTPGLR